MGAKNLGKLVRDTEEFILFRVGMPLSERLKRS